METIEYYLVPKTRRAFLTGFAFGLLLGIGVALAANGLWINVRIHHEPANSAPAAP